MATPSPAHDKRWESLLVSALLESLREEAQARYLGDAKEYQGSKQALKRAEQLRQTIGAKKNHLRQVHLGQRQHLHQGRGRRAG